MRARTWHGSNDTLAVPLRCRLSEMGAVLLFQIQHCLRRVLVQDVPRFALAQAFAIT